MVVIRTRLNREGNRCTIKEFQSATLAYAIPSKVPSRWFPISQSLFLKQGYAAKENAAYITSSLSINIF
jgi:hypothetical protein